MLMIGETVQHAVLRLRGRALPQQALIDEAARHVQLDGRWLDVESLQCEPPVCGTVYGTLLNWPGTLAALGDAMHRPPYQAPPQAPVLYIKPRNTLNGHGCPVALPQGVEALQAGASLGLVIGRTACGVSERDALDHVAGYTVVNDFSVPHASFHRPSVRFKALDGSCAVGPWFVARARIENPDALEIRVYVDGGLRQRVVTNGLLRPAARLIADVTEFMTLRPGDVLTLGAPPEAPLARAGQRIVVEIETVGRLVNQLVPEASWPPGPGR